MSSNSARFKKNSSRDLYLTLLPELLGSFFFTFIAGVVVAGFAKATSDVLSAQRVLLVAMTEAFVYFALSFGMMKLTNQLCGYFNPALSFGLFLHDMLSSPSFFHVKRFLTLMVVQMAGAIGGAYAILGVVPDALLSFSMGGISITQLGETPLSAFGLCIVLSFVLMFVLFAVRNNEGRMSSFIFCYAYLVVRLISFPLYNGYFNPARTIAHAIMAGERAWAFVWIDAVGALGGAAIAALLFFVWNYGLKKH